MHRRLNALRRQSAALKQGGFQLLLAEGEVLAFLRESTDEKIIVVGNRGTDQTVFIPCWMAGLADGTRLIDALSEREVVVGSGKASLEPGTRPSRLSARANLAVAIDRHEQRRAPPQSFYGRAV